MNPRLLLPLLLLAVPLCGGDIPVPSDRPGRSNLIALGPDGRLRYTACSASGDVIPDFSHCGYGAGERMIPLAAVRATLEPAPSGDDSARIQAALDRVASLTPGADGLRGAVLLKRGTYRCAEVLLIRASGVVLRGEGDGPDGTVLVATARRQQVVVEIGGMAPRTAGPELEIADDYVPVGAHSFRVSNPSGLRVGQAVLVVRRGNAAWITELGMDRIKPRPGAPDTTRQWKPFDLRFDRIVTAVEGNTITVDAPIACAIERRWGSGTVVAVDDARRIEDCGVESLRFDSVYDAARTAVVEGKPVAVDEDHATHAVRFAAVKNAWARGLTTLHFYHGPAVVSDAAKWITVEDCAALVPVSQITGGRRYPYAIEGQLALVQRCRADHARHAFVFGARVAGPNVFLDCHSTNDHATSEPHHRWSVGGLYDNVEGMLAFQDRQWMGTGHGWAGANYVAWNCRGSLVCQRPPTAQNFAIGFVGQREAGAFHRDAGWWESEGTPVAPRSLYLQQLRDRLGAGFASARPDLATP